MRQHCHYWELRQTWSGLQCAKVYEDYERHPDCGISAQSNWHFSGDAGFGVRSVDLTQSFTNLTHGGVNANSVDDVGHGVGGGYIAVGTRLRLASSGLF